MCSTKEDNYIAWQGGPTKLLDSGSTPSLTCMPVGQNVIVEHNSSSTGALNQTSMVFNTELSSIKYDDAIVLQAKEICASSNTLFRPSKIWAIEECYSCSGIYSFDTEEHVGGTVSAEFD